MCFTIWIYIRKFIKSVLFQKRWPLSASTTSFLVKEGLLYSKSISKMSTRREDTYFINMQKPDKLYLCNSGYLCPDYRASQNPEKN